MTELFPLFLNLNGRRVLVVGEGPVADAKARALEAAGAAVRAIAPAHFDARDLRDVWLVVTAASPEVNRRVAAEAEARRIFVNAVDDPANATAFLSGVVGRGGVTIAISTSGAAPALTGLLREAIDAVLPADLDMWLKTAIDERANWKRDNVPIERRRPLLLAALNQVYEARSGAEATASRK